LFFFEWQTSAWWEHIIVLSVFIHCSLSFWLLDHPIASAIVEFLCLMVSSR
jgi:hypothetical protein